MKGPLKLRFRLLGDARDFPIRAFIDVRKGGITHEDVEELSRRIYQNAAHLVLILTDRGPSLDVRDELESLPQIIVTTVEQRDLVKLLVISLAKSRGEDIEENLLSRAYAIMFEKFGLREQMVKWLERMSEKGYVLDFEGFVDRTVSACRFFINSMGKPLTLEDCWNESWALRDLLPFGIESKIIPDMGLDDLEKHARILKNYRFIDEKAGRYYVQRHSAEERAIDLIDRHDGATNKTTLINHFMFREVNSHIFEALLEHMERKLMISMEHRDIVHYLSLPDIKRLRDAAVSSFGQKRLMLESSNAMPFAHIITWKEREWSLIDLSAMQKTIESILSEVSTAVNEDIIRSRTLLISELVNWYSTYVDKVTLAKYKSNDLASKLEIEVKSLEHRAKTVVANLVKATRAVGLEVEVQELQRARSELDELKNSLTENKSFEEMEKLLKPLAGDKKARDTTRKEKLTTEIDEEMKSRGIRGDWSVGKYVLVASQARKVESETEGLNDTLISLDTLSKDLVQVAEEIPGHFLQARTTHNTAPHLKLVPVFIEISQRIAEGVVTKSPFPLNVRTVTINELRNAMEEHVRILKSESANAEKVRKSIGLLEESESILTDSLQKTTLLETLYEGFWEEEVPESLKREKLEIGQAYDSVYQRLSGEVEDFSDFRIIEKKSEQTRRSLEEIDEKAEETEKRLTGLFDDVRHYIRVGLTFVERLRRNLLPKLTKSDIKKIEDISNELYVLYEWTSQWMEKAIAQIIDDVSSPEIPKHRTAILDEERKLREALVREIKDLEAQETLIVLELVDLSAARRQPLPLLEASQIVAKKIGLDEETVKKLLLNISDKGFLTLSITF
jgi:hypothetical protein